MKKSDVQLGKPSILYKGTTAELDALSAVEGMQAYDTTLGKFVYYDGSNWAEVGGGGSITVEEQDGTPSVSSVNKIKVTNGTLTDDGSGVVSLDFGSAATDGAAIHNNVANEISAVTEKTTLHNDDLLLIEDSEASYVKKKVKLLNISSGSGTDENAIHDNVSGEIAAITEKTSLADDDIVLIEDSAATNAKKKSKISTFLAKARSILFLNEITTPSTPASGQVSLYAKDGGLPFVKNDLGVESPIALGGVWQDWTPSWSASGSMTISSVSLNVARYYTMGKTFTYFVDARFTLGGTANNAVILTLPSGISPKYFAACGGWIINGGGLEAAAAYVRDTGVAEARPATGLNWTLGIDKRLSIFGTVELT